MRDVGARRAPLRAEGLRQRIGTQRANDQTAWRGLGDTDAERPPVVSNVRGLLLDFLTTGTRRGRDDALPAVLGQPPPLRARVVDPSPIDSLDADRERKQPPGD